MSYTSSSGSREDTPTGSVNGSSLYYSYDEYSYNIEETIKKECYRCSKSGENIRFVVDPCTECEDFDICSKCYKEKDYCVKCRRPIDKKKRFKVRKRKQSVSTLDVESQQDIIKLASSNKTKHVIFYLSCILITLLILAGLLVGNYYDWKLILDYQKSGYSHKLDVCVCNQSTTSLVPNYDLDDTDKKDNSHLNIFTYATCKNGTLTVPFVAMIHGSRDQILDTKHQIEKQLAAKTYQETCYVNHDEIGYTDYNAGIRYQRGYYEQQYYFHVLGYRDRMWHVFHGVLLTSISTAIILSFIVYLCVQGYAICKWTVSGTTSLRSGADGACLSERDCGPINDFCDGTCVRWGHYFWCVLMYGVIGAIILSFVLLWPVVYHFVKYNPDEDVPPEM